MDTKSLFASKTFWVNALAAVAACVQALDGQPWFDPTIQAAILAVVNIVLRVLTGQPVTISGGNKTTIALVLACGLALGVAGCATSKRGTTTTPAISTADAITQAVGATAAVSALTASLPSTGPTAADADTVAHIQGYAAWAGVALRALGIVATVAGL